MEYVLYIGFEQGLSQELYCRQKHQFLWRFRNKERDQFTAWLKGTDDLEDWFSGNVLGSYDVDLWCHNQGVSEEPNPVTVADRESGVLLDLIMESEPMAEIIFWKAEKGRKNLRLDASLPW